MLAAALPAQLVWRTDLSAALAEAEAEKRPVLVCIHEFGDARSEAMAKVFAAPQFARLGKAAIPMLVAHVPPGREAELARLTGEGEVDTVRARSFRALLDLFGPRATVTTPQQILLDARGEVLWQNIGVTSADQLARAVASATRNLTEDAPSRGRRAVRQAEALARSARRDPAAQEKLRVLARRAPLSAFAEVMEQAARAGVARDIVAAAVTAMADGARRERCTALLARRSCRDVGELAQDLLDRSDDAGERSREVYAPLPALRTADDLASVHFADGRTRSLANLRGKAVLLWFFLPDDQRLVEQANAVAPVMTELMAAGVEVLAVAASDKPIDAGQVAERRLFSCPVGTYLYDATAPWQGVDFFPAAVVIDDESRLIYDDHGPAVKEYAGFAPTVRGLQRYLDTRPEFTHRE